VDYTAPVALGCEAGHRAGSLSAILQPMVGLIANVVMLPLDPGVTLFFKSLFVLRQRLCAAVRLRSPIEDK